MFDSLSVARQLTEASIEGVQADVIADAIRQAAEHGEHVTPETLPAEVATLHGVISSLRADIIPRDAPASRCDRGCRRRHPSATRLSPGAVRADAERLSLR